MAETEEIKVFGGARAFLQIPVAIARDKDLLEKPKSIILMGEICSMLNTTGSFYMSNKSLAKRLRCSKSTIKNYLNLLERKKLITRTVVRNSDNNVIGRKISAGDSLGQLAGLGWANDLARGRSKDWPRVGQHVGRKYSSIKEHSNRSVNNLSLTRRETKNKSNPLNLLTAEEAGAAKLAKNSFQQWGRPQLSENEMKQLCLAIKGRSVSAIGRLTNKATELATVDPFQYFLTLIKNEPKERAE